MRPREVIRCGPSRRRGAWGALLLIAGLAAPGSAQVVEAPSLPELQRWSDGCLGISSEVWISVDLLHDDLIEAIRAITATGGAAVSAQALLEERFVADLAALGTVAADDPCLTRVREEREMERLRLLLAVRRQHAAIADVDALLDPLRGGDPAVVEAIQRVEDELRKAALDALRSLAGDVPSADPRSRIDAAVRAQRGPERTFALASARALKRLKGVVAEDALTRAQGRWARAVSRRSASDVDRTILMLRYLKAGPPEAIARGRPLADELELAFDRRFANDVEAALRSADSNALRSVAATFTEEEWSKVRELIPDERGEQLVLIARNGQSLGGAYEMLLELVTDEGLDYLAPFMGYGDDLPGEDPTSTTRDAVAMRAAARRWFGRGPNVHASERDVTAVTAIVATEGNASARDAAIAAWKEAYDGPIARLREERFEKARLAGMAECPPDRLMEEHVASDRLDDAIREADDRLRDRLMLACDDAGCRLALAAWRLDRLELLAQSGAAQLAYFGFAVRAPWGADVEAALAAATPEAREAALDSVSRRFPNFERLAIAMIDVGRQTARRSMEQEAVRWAYEQEVARRRGEGARTEWGIALSDADMRRIAELQAARLAELPPIKVSPQELANRWLDEVERLVADIATAAGNDVAVEARRAIARRTALATTRDRSLIELHRALAEVRSRDDATELVQRTEALGNRLEESILRGRLALRYPPGREGIEELSAQVSTLIDRERWLREDRRLAIDRLRRDVAHAGSPASVQPLGTTGPPTSIAPEPSGMR